MVDAVLAHELEALVRVLLVDAHDPLGQGHAELVLLAVGHLQVDVDLLAGAIAGLDPDGGHGGLEPVHLAGGDVGGREQADLLGLAVLEGRRAVELVGVVLEEGALGELLARGLGLHGPHAVFHVGGLGPDAVHVARHQGELGVVVGGAALVVQGDPAVQVRLALVLGDHQHVVAAPREAAGQVRGLGLLLAGGPVVLQEPLEGGTRHQVGGHLGQHDLAGRLEVDLVADAVDLTVVGAEQRGLAHGVVGVDLDVLADVLLEQLVWGEQVVLVVLLQDLEVLRRAERSQGNGRRVDPRGHVRVLQLALALFELDGAHLAHQAQVVVVDGQGQVLAVLGGALLGPGRGGGAHHQAQCEQALGQFRIRHR
ncbi:hypothetical protein D3C86_1371930 [compost metagenome]